MVQTFFETYETYRDSVYYDASAWSVANFYNIKYKTSTKAIQGTPVISKEELIELEPLISSSYAYAVDAKDYNLLAFIYDAQQHKIVVAAAFKPFSAKKQHFFFLWISNDSCGFSKAF